MDKTKLLLSSGIILIFMLFPVSMSTSVPVNQNIILKFGDSYEETIAIDTLLENNGNTKVLEVNHLFVRSELARSLGKVFIVGHGSDDGIKTSNGLMTYDDVNEMLAISSGIAFIYVACNSSEAAKSLNKANTFGFTGEVEPVTAALIASYISGSKTATLDKIIYRMVDVSNNPSAYSTLSLGPVETAGHVAAIMTLIGISVLTATALAYPALLKTTIAKTIAGLTTGFFATLATAVTTTFVTAIGNGDLWEMLSIIVIIFQVLSMVLVNIFSGLPWWLVFGVSAVVTIDSIINSLGSWAKAILLIGLGTAMFAFQFYMLFRDKDDTDDYFMFTVYGYGE